MYLYCGECRECADDEHFNRCKNENCCEFNEHPSGHGYFCIECDIKFKISRYRKGETFCSLDCYKEWREEMKKQKQQRRIDKLERKKFKIIDKDSKFEILNDM